MLREKAEASTEEFKRINKELRLQITKLEGEVKRVAGRAGWVAFCCLVLCGRRAILSHAQPPCAPSSFSKQAAVMAERFKDAERRRIELDEVHRCISKPTTPHSWLCLSSPHRVCSRPRSGLRRRFRSEAFIKTRNWTVSRLLLMRCATHSRHNEGPLIAYPMPRFGCCCIPAEGCRAAAANGACSVASKRN